MRRSLFILPILFLLASCGGEGGGTQAGSAGLVSRPGPEFSPTVAEVGGMQISQAYLDYRFDNLNAMEKERYSGEDGRSRLLDKLIQETLAVQAALAVGTHRDPETEMRTDMAVRGVVFKSWYDQKFREELVVPEEEVVAHYEDNKENYMALGRARAQHLITSDEATARKAYGELLDGETFAKVAHDYSENSETAAQGGGSGWFNPGGYMLGIGFDEALSNWLYTLPLHELQEPVQMGGKWHVARLVAREEGEQQSLDKVRDRIERDLHPVLAEAAFNDEMKRLGRELGVRKQGKFADEDVRTADQLYAAGKEATNAHRRLDLFERLVDNYPDHELSDDALFMVGFIYSEDFADVPHASSAFRKLLRNYPDSEFVEDAEFMLSNLGRKSPSIRGRQTPATPSAISERIDAVRGG